MDGPDRSYFGSNGSFGQCVAKEKEPSFTEKA